MLASLKLKFKLSLVYWLNSTQFKIESKISFLRKILRNILRFGKFFCYKLPNHVQIYDLGHFLGKIITLLNLCLVLLLEQSIVHTRVCLYIKIGRANALFKYSRSKSKQWWYVILKPKTHQEKAAASRSAKIGLLFSFFSSICLSFP